MLSNLPTEPRTLDFKNNRMDHEKDIYNDYEQEKLRVLRERAENELKKRQKRQEEIEVIRKEFNSLTVGDQVIYRRLDVWGNLKGEVIRKFESGGQISFDVRCGKDTYMGIDFDENLKALSKRITSKERYKDVKVREEFVELSTQDLVSKLRDEDPTHHMYWDHMYSSHNPEVKNHQLIKELRAELSRRPNIKGKKKKGDK